MLEILLSLLVLGVLWITCSHATEGSGTAYFLGILFLMTFAGWSSDRKKIKKLENELYDLKNPLKGEETMALLDIIEAEAAKKSKSD